MQRRNDFVSSFILNFFRERDITNYRFSPGIKASNDLFYGEILLEDREGTGVRADTTRALIETFELS